MKNTAVCLLLFFSNFAFAWDGYDPSTGNNVTIEKGNLVRSGSDIEVYDNATGEYKNVEVQSVTGNGSGAQVDVYDYETGESSTFDME